MKRWPWLLPTSGSSAWDRLNWWSTALGLGIAVVILVGAEINSLRSDFRHRLASLADLITDNSLPALAFNDSQAALTGLAALARTKEVAAARIVLKDGQEFAVYQRPQPAASAPWWAGVVNLAEMEFRQSIVFKDERLGEIVFQADLAPVRERLLHFIFVALASSIGAMALARLLMHRLRRTIHRHERDLAHMAHFDSLTDLPNRASFELHLSKSLVREGDGALLFFDLDNFKLVNDSLGHAAGDLLLQEVANRVSRMVRQSDHLARLGGDEFTLTLASVSPGQAEQVARHLMRALHRPFVLDGHEVILGASVGIALFPQDGTSVDVLLRSADTALYAAKAAGKHTSRFYSEDMKQLAQRRLSLDVQLRHALERGELAMHYQPIVHLASGTVVGYEALMRWSNEALGQVDPEVFIPLAEESGLIHELGSFALAEAASVARRWCDTGRDDLFVAVNVSPRQFTNPDLPGVVEGMLVHTGLPAHCLELEITESALMTPCQEVTENFRRLHALGVRLSLDDFGVGYASLAQLKRLPIHKIKIDRSFVNDIPDDEDDAAIIAAIVKMAETLNLKVVAEGVETQDQQDFLAALGCEMGQGWLFGKPEAMPR